MAVVREIEPWDALLAAGRADERLVRQAMQHERFPQQVALPAALHPDVVGALRRRGIEDLWSHQAEALESAWERTTITTTGTASGKSLCFQLPTLEILSRDARARALFLYPAKALAQDQARSLHAFGLRRVRAAIYDGDTPRETRAELRRRANLVLTNPDMLHVGILPNHSSWADFFRNLAVVVIDEAHVYRGVFGSHVANVLRRLRRICELHGTAPRFLLASATVANPGELATRLTGFDDVAVISRDGSPGTKRTIAMWNPPLVDEARGARGSVLAEAAHLLVSLVLEDARTIVFMKSRKAVELMARFAVLELQRRGHPGLAARIAPYRAGYTAQQRRALEAQLVSGELLGVVATDALELGIDIGSLDAAICVTFPGTVASLRQMWGRAGRRGRGLAVYVAGEDALDQFFCRHPDEFLERPVEAAILDHENEQLFSAHLLCAAHEAPLEAADADVLGPRWREFAEALVGAGDLRARPDGSFVPRRADEYPAGALSLRSAGRDPVAVVDDRVGRADRQRRRGPRAVDGPPGRDLPARRAAVRGRDVRLRRPARVRARVRRRLVHAGQEGDRHRDRARARRADGARRAAELRDGRRQRAGAGLPAAPDRRRRGDRPHAVGSAAHVLCHPGTVVRTGSRNVARSEELATTGGRNRSPRHAARRRALPDRRPPAARDVRPLGHRRPLDQLASPDRHADDLHLRRPPRRHRHRSPRLRGLRAPRRRRPPPGQRVPVRVRLSLLRAVTEVRQPQRAALQGRLHGP